MLGILFRMKITWKLARALGGLWYALDVRHRRIAMRNLDLAFKHELSESSRRVLCRDTFIHLACVFIELPLLLWLSKKNLDDFITFSGTENLEAALKGQKGILVMASHFGNWELMALAYSLRFDPLTLVVRPLDNPLLDRAVTKIRCRGGNQTLPKRGSSLSIMRLLRKGKMVALLIDQNAYLHEGVFVPFFNELACANKALATLALRTGATVLPVYNFRHPDGRYEMIFEPTAQLVRTGDMNADIEKNTALFNSIIERYVRLHPEQWLWLHQRWKTRPYQIMCTRVIRLARPTPWRRFCAAVRCLRPPA